MKGDKDLKTLECLRARLLAERQVSRFAKEDSERMENKLIELENKLRKEIKMRNRAEKRLQFLRKKLESLNIISSNLLQSDQSSSSEKSENCFSSSTTTTTSTTFASEENNEPLNNFTINSVTSQGSNHNNEDNSFAELKSSSMSKNIEDQLEDYSVDDSRAIVPIMSLVESSSSLAKTKSNEAKPVNENVAQVLDSLRYIRETIQRSIEMQCMVRVDPT